MKLLELLIKRKEPITKIILRINLRRKVITELLKLLEEKLKGEIIYCGSKNEALQVINAVLLTEKDSYYQ